MEEDLNTIITKFYDTMLCYNNEDSILCEQLYTAVYSTIQVSDELTFNIGKMNATLRNAFNNNIEDGIKQVAKEYHDNVKGPLKDLTDPSRYKIAIREAYNIMNKNPDKYYTKGPVQFGITEMQEILETIMDGTVVVGTLFRKDSQLQNIPYLSGDDLHPLGVIEYKNNYLAFTTLTSTNIHQQ